MKSWFWGDGFLMKNKTVFITGGNEGIGFATALLFAEQGCNVAIMGRRADKNAEALKGLLKTGAQCIAISGDVTREADVARAVAQVTDTFGALHYAFNNAGVTGNPVPFPELSTDEFDRVIGINLKGVWLSMKYELPAILASGGGGIVNTGSIASGIGVSMLPAYVASKHAIVGLSRAAALEYGKQGIRINVVCPGMTTDTGIYAQLGEAAPEVEAAMIQMVPMGRFGQPREIAQTVMYLCSDAASYITGQALYADGGYTVP